MAERLKRSDGKRTPLTCRRQLFAKLEAQVGVPRLGRVSDAGRLWYFDAHSLLQSAVSVCAGRSKV
jgi:hypothetical protein